MQWLSELILRVLSREKFLVITTVLVISIILTALIYIKPCIKMASFQYGDCPVLSDYATTNNSNTLNGYISMKVVDDGDGGNPVEGVTICIFGNHLSDIRKTGYDGQVVFASLYPDRYRIIASYNGKKILEKMVNVGVAPVRLTESIAIQKIDSSKNETDLKSGRKSESLHNSYPRTTENTLQTAFAANGEAAPEIIIEDRNDVIIRGRIANSRALSNGYKLIRYLVVDDIWYLEGEADRIDPIDGSWKMDLVSGDKKMRISGEYLLLVDDEYIPLGGQTFKRMLEEVNMSKGRIVAMSSIND